MAIEKVAVEAGKELTKAFVKAAERGKFNKLASELSRRAINMIEKEGQKKADEISFGMKFREPGKNEISFLNNGDGNFPWENHGFFSAEEIENSLRSGSLMNEMIKAERHPAKLPTDVSKRLLSESRNLNAAKWANAGVTERIAMLEKAYRIIAEEACVPQNIIDETKIFAENFHDEKGKITNAGTNVFVGLDENDDLIMTDSVKLFFNVENLAASSYSFEKAIGTLYHETIHIMQEYSLTEGKNSFSYSEMQREWKENIVDRLKKIEEFHKSGKEFKSTHVEYLTEPLETYAHMQDQYFLEIWKSMEQDGYRR